MHYENQYGPKKRTPDGDLFAADTRIQLHPVVQYPAVRKLDERVPFAHALSGYDPDRVAESDYTWTVP
jgi:hypothetical protein